MLWYIVGYIVSCATKEVSMTTTILPVMVAPIALFGGYYIKDEFVITFTESKNARFVSSPQ